MDNTALEIIVAVLWTVAVFALPAVSVFIGGAIAVIRFGVRARSQGGTGYMSADDPFKFVSESAKRGFFAVLISLVVALILAVVSIIFSVNAWVAVAA